jgi:AraC-like DNA-binding protein
MSAPTAFGAAGDGAAETRFETTDRDAAMLHVSKSFAPHDLRLSSGQMLAFRLDLVTAPRLVFGRMRYGANATIDGPAMGRCYHLTLPQAGESTVVQRGVRRTVQAGTTGVIFEPSTPRSVTWSRESWQHHVKLPASMLEAHAARLAGAAGGPPGELDFELTFDVGDGAGQALLAMLRFLEVELTKPDGLSANTLASRELESAFLTQLLAVVPSRTRDELKAGSGASRSGGARIHELIEYIDAHLAEDLALADLTEASGLSARSVQIGFRREFGVSPTEFVRERRLDRAHHELLQAGPGSVTDTAMRWGLFHLGRFAQQYRIRFGELPSETAAAAGLATRAANSPRLPLPSCTRRSR